MEYIIQNDKNKHLIVLVHGLNGGDTSWRGSEQRFAETFSKDTLIKEHFDLALFTYGTKIFKMNWLAKVINTIRGFLWNRPKEDIAAFNVGIDSVSRPLESEIRGIYEKYDTISFLAHSMGGLVTKSALTWLNEEVCKKIQLFISLSVPHIGAKIADYGAAILGNNPQLLDLEAMGTFTTQLNERFASLKYLPKIVYQSGNQDTIVPRASGVPPGVPSSLVESTADNHFSILLIKDSKNNALFSRIIKELNIVIQPFFGVEVYVEQGTPFGFLLETMAAQFKVQIDTSCFIKEELDTKLRADKINSTSVEDFFFRIGELAITKLPEYTVKKERGTLNYTFHKIDKL